MALIKTNYETGHGLTIPEAYVIVIAFSGDPYTLHFTTRVFATYDAYEAGKSFLGEYSHTIPYVDGMGLSATYDHLLTLPEFTGATVHIEPSEGSPQE